MKTSGELLGIAREIVGKVRFCMVVSVAESGEANARAVEPFPLGEDWSIAFVTDRSSRKAKEIARNGQLTLAFQHDEDGAYVSLVGRARIDADADARQACWRDSLNQWFPTGPDDPDAVVVRFDTDRIELLSLAKAVMPPPKGRRAAVLVRDTSGWSVTQT